MTRILHLTPSLAQGGIESLIVDLLGALPEHRHTVVTFVGLPRHYDLPAGAELLEIGEISGASTGLLGRLVKRSRALRLAKRVAEVARAAEPDLIIAWNGPSLALSLAARRATGAPLIWSVHCPALPAAAQDRVLMAELRAYAPMTHHVAACHFVSNSSASWHEELGWSPGEITVVPGAVDTERFKPGPAREGAADEPYRLVLPARFSPEKGHAVLAKAARILKDQGRNIAITCCGRDTDGPALKAIIQAEGVADVMMGIGARTDMPEVYATHDAMMCASTFESGPLVTLEALACGLPVISTDVGLVRDVVDEMTGRVVPVDDPEALARAIVSAMNDPRLAASARTAGPMRVQMAYSLDAMAAQWRDLIDDTIAEGQEHALPVTRRALVASYAGLAASIGFEVVGRPALGLLRRMVPDRRTLVLSGARLLIGLAILAVAAHAPAWAKPAATFVGNAFFFLAVLTPFSHAEGIVVGGIVDRLLGKFGSKAGATT